MRSRTKKASNMMQRNKDQGGSVQQDFVRLREVFDQVMCLASPRATSRREYATAIRVGGHDIGLKDVPERTAIFAKYRTLLNSLTHPIQILIRILPLNLERYLAHLTRVPPGAPPIWMELAQAQRNMVLEHARERTLLDRSFYIMIPANLDRDLPGGLNGLTRTTFFPWGRGRREHLVQEAALEQAALLLGNRAREIMRQLGKMNLQTSRLGEQEHIELYSSCLMPLHHLAAPLPVEVLDGIAQPFQRKGSGRGARAQEMRLFEEFEQAAGQAQRADNLASGKQGQQGPPAYVQSPFSQLADRLSPASIKVSESMVSLGKTSREYASTIIVDGLPGELPDAVLHPLLEANEVMDIALHIDPQHRVQSIHKLRWERTGQMAQRRYAASKGNELVDAEVEVREGHTVNLMRQLVSGEESMIAHGMYVLARADSKAALEKRSERIMLVLRSMQMVPRTALFLQDEGYHCFLPEAYDPLAQWGNAPQFTGDCGAAFYPFMSTSLFMPDGILMGFTPTNQPIAIDRWDSSLPNPHMTIIGESGSGKSLVRKDLVDRSYVRGLTAPCKTIIIDPEGEYLPIAEALGGQWIRLAPGSGHRINPLDLSVKAGSRSHRTRFDSHEDKLALKIQAMRAVCQMMICNHDADRVIPLEAGEMGMLDRALHELYRRFGISSNPSTHTRPMPLMRDFYEELKRVVGEADPYGLCNRLYPYVYGSHSALFDGQTNVNLDDDLVVFDTFDLGKDLVPAMLTVLSDYVWNATFESDLTREFIIDEAGILGEYEAWAQFMVELTSRARKHGMAITLIMQDVTMLQNKRARSILGNCALKLLMGPPTPGIREVEQLSESEIQEMRSFGKGDALLIAPQKHIILHHTASAVEYRLATTDHRERAQIRREQEEALKAVGGTDGPGAPLNQERETPAALARVTAATAEPGGTGLEQGQNGKTGKARQRAPQ